MTLLSEEQLNELSEQLRSTTLEDLLLICIRDTGLTDTVSMLDLIATQTGQRIAMFNWEGRTYPANGGDLTIPPPDWQCNLRESNKSEIPEYPIYPLKEETDAIPIDDEKDTDGGEDSVEGSIDKVSEETVTQSQVEETPPTENPVDDKAIKGLPGETESTQNDGDAAKTIGGSDGSSE